jgi:two-component system response regulator FlrC
MGTAIRILLVDDDDGVRQLIDYVLRDRGYQVRAVDCAAAALSLLKEQRYDFVVADAKLPDGAGVAIADWAKAHGMKAVILTGYAPETRQGGPQHDYLFKPIRPEELVRAVERYVGPAQGR